jgi:hypothetical protein
VAAVIGALLAFTPDAGAVDFTNSVDYPVGDFPFGLAIADFNADARADLAVGNLSSNDVSILTGAGDGTFGSATNIPAGNRPLSVAIGNFNGDTDPDLAIANNELQGTLSILLGAAGSSFTAEPSSPYATDAAPQSVALGDFNGDSDPDLAVATWDGVSVHLGATGGSFTAPTDIAIAASGPNDSRFVAVSDFNGDSDPDLAVATEDTGDVAILLGGPAASFSAPTYYGAGDGSLLGQESVAIADFNGDSDPDLAVTDYPNGVAILLGSTGGTFTGPTTFAAGGAASIAVGKFNDDNDPDLAMAQAGNGGIVIVLGGAGGTFGAPVTFGIANSTPMVAVRDLDGDGNDDVAVTESTTDSVAVLLQLDQHGYARPKGASPLNIRLVPAFAQCSGSSPAGMTHGAPLAVPSCSPPAQSSAYLTMNAPDRSAPYNTGADGTGGVTLQVTCLVPGTTTQITGAGGTPPCSGAGDQEDVKITTTSTGVRCVGVSGGCTSAGGQYAGKVMGAMTLRITDKGNGQTGTSPGTAQDYPFRWGVQCSSATCNSVTSADAVIPGLVVEQAREVWQLSQVQVFDGGADGDLATTPSPGSGTCPPACEGNGDGESLFLQQGLFAP